MIITCESVSPRHPDKLCDQISDAILDECLMGDRDSRVAVETMGGHGIITVTGEITTTAFVDIKKIVNRIVPNMGVQVNLVTQSPEIAQGVDTGGAGDQGVMIGYACDETKELMPIEVIMARSLCQAIYKEHPYDGKTQVTVDLSTKKKKVLAVVASFCNVSKGKLEKFVEIWKIRWMIDYPIDVYLNPAGDWNQGGFDADTGVTGRKIVIDSYGPRVPIGGGAFSGKDPSKVDRSGAYMARKLAVNFLKEHKAHEVYCYLSFAIGKKDAIQSTVIIDGKEEKLDMVRVADMIEVLDLKKPQYEETAMWGHFGQGFSWG